METAAVYLPYPAILRVVMTYGDKYFALTEKFIGIQDQFIAALQRGDIDELAPLNLELQKIHKELNGFRAFMKANKLTFADVYKRDASG